MTYKILEILTIDSHVFVWVVSKLSKDVKKLVQRENVNNMMYEPVLCSWQANETDIIPIIEMKKQIWKIHTARQ